MTANDDLCAMCKNYRKIWYSLQKKEQFVVSCKRVTNIWYNVLFILWWNGVAQPSKRGLSTSLFINKCISRFKFWLPTSVLHPFGCISPMRISRLSIWSIYYEVYITKNIIKISNVIFYYIIIFVLHNLFWIAQIDNLWICVGLIHQNRGRFFFFRCILK
jgi:hypothetical protein